MRPATTSRLRRGAALVLVLATVAGVAACTVDASRSGAPRDVLAARLGTPDTHGRPSTPIIEGFVRRLMEAGIHAKPDWPVSGTARSDEDVARQVSTGKVEFAVVPARAWDLLGVDTLRPLQLPGLIATDASAAAVAGDGVSDTLLDGLTTVGVVGLALVPEGVRRVFVFAPHTPGGFSFKGAQVRTLPSKASDEVFGALGATAVHADGDELTEAVGDGRISAAETSWGLVPSLPGRPEAVANAALGVKFDVIAVNADWYSSRTAAEREAIRAAARATADAAIAEAKPDASQAAEFCHAGGVIEPGPPEVTRAMTKARRMLAQQWGDHGDAAPVITRLQELAAVGPPVPLAPCTPAPGSPSPAPTGEAGQFPPGTYRMQVSVAELVDAGMNEMDANEHAGTWTISFHNGELDMGDGCLGTYRVVTGRVELHLGGQDACGDARDQVLFTGRWETDSRSLRFLDLESGADEPAADAFIQALFQDRPFIKIG